MNQSELPPLAPNDELWSLVTSYFDGTATQEECDRMELRLREDSAAKMFFLRYSRLHAALHLRSRREPLSLAALLGRQSQPDLLPPVGGSLVDDDSGASTGTTSFMFGSFRDGILVRWRSMLVYSVLSGLVLLVAGTLVLSVAMQFRPNVAHASNADVLGELHRTVGCIWRTGNLPTYEGAQLNRGVLRLERGEAAVRFASGVTAVLQGPVDFEVSSSLRCFVHSGRAVIKVPPESSGFVIGTPVVEMTSHGSEVGVDVEEGRRLLLHVFDGELQVAPNLSLPAAAAGRLLAVGQSLVIGPDGSDETSARAIQAREFIREVRQVPVLLTPTGEVRVVNVEFGPEGSDAYRGIGVVGLNADDLWNQVGEIGGVSAPLKDAGSRPTDVTVTVDAQMMFTTSFHASGNAFHDDICWVRDGGSTGRFVIRGLLPGGQYDLYLYGTTGICPRQPAEYELAVGAPEGSVFTIGNESKATVGLRASDRPFSHGRDYVTFERVTADYAGEIRGTWTNNPQSNAPLNNNPFAPFNGFQIVGKFGTKGAI